MKRSKLRLRKWALLPGLFLLSSACASAVRTVPEGVGEAVVTGAGGVPIFTASRGPGEAPAIIMVHGLKGDHTTWDSLFRGESARRCRVIVMDLRGHGRSGRPPDPPSYEGDVWAQDLKAVLDHYRPRSPVLLGWSFGGRVVLDYLSLHGQGDLAGVVLIATSAGGGPRGPRRCTGPLDPAAAEGPVLPAVRSGGRRDHGVTLEKISVPVLILQGSLDRIVPPARADYIEARTPNGRKIVFDGTGHEVHLEMKDEFERTVLEFVEGLPEE